MRACGDAACVRAGGGVCVCILYGSQVVCPPVPARACACVRVRACVLACLRARGCVLACVLACARTGAEAMRKKTKNEKRREREARAKVRAREAARRRRQHNETTWPYIVDEVERARVIARVERKAALRRFLESAPPVCAGGGTADARVHRSPPPESEEPDVIVDPVAVEACIRAEQAYYGTEPDADPVQEPVSGADPAQVEEETPLRRTLREVLRPFGIDF